VGNETFVDILKAYLEQEMKFLEAQHNNFIDEAIECIGCYGLFLNTIPLQHENLDQVLSWFYDYYSTNSINKLIKKYTIQEDASKKIKKILRTMEKFEDVINEYFEDNLIDIQHLEEWGEDDCIMTGLQILKTKEILSALDIVNELKNDLIKKEFKIFNKHHFYLPKTTSKQDLKFILKELKKQFNLSMTELDIDTFINHLPMIR